MGWRQWVDLARAIGRRQADLRLSSTAAAAGFWLFMSIIPAAIVIVNLLGVVLDQQVIADALARMSGIFPGSFGQILTDRLNEIAAPSPGTGLLDTLLVIISIWTVSTAAREVLGTLDRIFDRPALNFMSSRLRSIVVAALCLVAIGAATIATIAADDAGGSGTSTVVQILLMAALVFVLYLAVSHGRVHVRRTLIASVAVSAALYALAMALRTYVALSADMSRVYGTAGGVMAAMLTAYLGSYALLFGALLSRRLTEWQAPLTEAESVAAPSN